MGKEKKSEHPFGGFFGVIGAIVGFGFAVSATENFLAGLIVGAIGYGLGLFIEHLVFRLIVIGLFIVMIVGRQILWEAVQEAFAFEPDLTPPAIEQQTAQNSAAGSTGAKT